MFVFGSIAAVIMGISLGLIGGGGSILTVPILYYFFGQDSLTATTNSLFVVGVTALAGAIINAKKGLIDFKTGLLFALPSFAGVYVARQFIIPNIPDVLFSAGGVTLTKALLVMIAFALLMIWASRAMIRSGRQIPVPNASDAEVVPALVNVVIKGFMVGATTGFVGAGGGFLIIPALVLLLRLPMRVAVGTSLAIIAANSLFGFGISPKTVGASTDWPLLLMVCALGIAGIFVGQLYSSRVEERHLKRGFGVFVLVVGSAILIDQLVRMF